jgi:uncharacterized protein YjiS (DUF1127 family)
MFHSLRRHDTATYAADITVRLRHGDDYIIRHHEFADDVHYRDAQGLVALLRIWRRRYVTRRQLRLLDARGVADIGLDAHARDCEVGKPFWMT